MIKHDGKDKPVENDTTVIVKLRYGGVKVGKARRFIWEWVKTPYAGDIVEYGGIYETRNL